MSEPTERPPAPRLMTNTPIDTEIAMIKAHVLQMGEWALQMVMEGVASMEAADPVKAARVVAMDDRLDAFDVDIEHEAIRILVTRQPAARDARTLGAILKVNTYLDRVGRLGLDVAKYVRDTPVHPPLPQWALLRMMCEQGCAMVRASLKSFETGDLKLAAEVYRADDAVDELNRQVLKECIKGLQGDPPEPAELVIYVLISRHLERIADNACKIAEKTIYMETGHRRREFLTPNNKVAL
jgi:phosphate transport system protein